MVLQQRNRESNSMTQKSYEQMTPTPEKKGINNKKAVLASMALLLTIGGGIIANKEYKNHSVATEAPTAPSKVPAEHITVEDTFVAANNPVEIPTYTNRQIHIEDTFATPTNPVEIIHQ